MKKLTLPKKCFDPNNAVSLVNIGKESFIEIVSIFDEYALNCIKKIMSASDKSDITTIEYNSHSLKSASFNVGAIRLATIATNIEQLSKENQLKKAVFMAEQLQSEFINFFKEYNLWLTKNEK